MGKNGAGKKGWRRLRLGCLLVVLFIASICGVVFWVQEDGHLKLVAAAAKRPLIAKVLPAAVLNMHIGDEHTLLTWAISERNDVELVKALLAAGSDPNVAPWVDGCPYGPPLAAAARKPNAEMVKALLAAGADANGKTSDGMTVLMRTAWCGRSDNGEVVQALLAAGAEVDARYPPLPDGKCSTNDGTHNPTFPYCFADKGGATALMFAAAEKKPAMVEALLAGGADVNALNEKGCMALLFARSKGDYMDEGQQERHRKTAQVLLAAGASVNGKDRRGMTGLVKAARNAPSHVKDLLRFGADPNLKAGENGETALMVAAENRDIEAVKLLLAEGADVNAQADKDGTTALMKAVWDRNPEVVNLLLAAHADVNARDKDGATALMRAAAENKAPKVIQALLAAGADVNARDNDGKTALNRALEKGHTAVAEALRAAGAKEQPPTQQKPLAP